LKMKGRPLAENVSVVPLTVAGPSHVKFQLPRLA
jgi:hypothetical protein